MPRDNDDGLDLGDIQIFLFQCILISTVIYYFIRRQAAIQPLPKIELFSRKENQNELLLNYLNESLESTDFEIGLSQDLSEEAKSALSDLREEIQNTEKKHTQESALEFFQNRHPTFHPLLICSLRVFELDMYQHENLGMDARVELISKIRRLLDVQYSLKEPSKNIIVSIGWILQHLHKLDEFSVQWIDANRDVDFDGLDGFISLSMVIAINNCYQQFSDFLENPEINTFSAERQIRMFDHFLIELKHSILQARHRLNAPQYRPFVRKIDQMFKRPDVPVYTNDFTEVAPVLLAKHPYLKPKAMTEPGNKPRYWASYGVTVEDSTIHHGVFVLSHTENERSDIFIDHCAGFYSGVWVIAGVTILKPFTQKEAKLKPEKVPYMILQQLYKHWEITKDEFELLAKDIKNELYKKTNFDSLNKNCKTVSLNFLKKINIFSPEVEGKVLGFMPSFSDGLRRGTMKECAILKDGKVIGRDKFDCAPMVWDEDTAPQLRKQCDQSPGFLATQAELVKAFNAGRKVKK